MSDCKIETVRDMEAIIEAQKDTGDKPSPHYVMKVYAESKGKPMNDGESITEWLARYYIPLPLDENGKPWNMDDECIYDGKLDKITGFDNKEDVWLAYRRTWVWVPNITRPLAPVLDADGVEIKVGETVWASTCQGWTKSTVTYIAKDGLITVDEIGVYPPSKITHREPDSLKKLLKDMNSYIRIHDCEPGSPACEHRDRLAALVERDSNGD